MNPQLFELNCLFSSLQVFGPELKKQVLFSPINKEVFFFFFVWFLFFLFLCLRAVNPHQSPCSVCTFGWNCAQFNPRKGLVWYLSVYLLCNFFFPVSNLDFITNHTYFLHFGTKCLFYAPRPLQDWSKNNPLPRDSSGIPT